jgi:hypothetical protein
MPLTASHPLIVRLPRGTEYWYAQEVPQVGEGVSHFGTRYVVVSCEPSEDDRVVVTLAEETSGADAAKSQLA